MSRKTYNAGDRVEVRDKDSEAWAPGVVEQTSPELLVKKDGWDKSFAWDQIKTYNTGDRVEVRDKDSEAWALGVVEETSPKLLVKKDGWNESFPWNQVRAAAWKAGDKVEAKYKGSYTWYPAKIVVDNGNGTYHVKFDDGDVDQKVPADSTRAPGGSSSGISSSYRKSSIAQMCKRPGCNIQFRNTYDDRGYCYECYGRYELRKGPVLGLGLREYDLRLGRFTDDRAFVHHKDLNGDKIMLAESYEHNHEDVYEKYGYMQSDVYKLGSIPTQGFCHKDTTDFATIREDQYESLGIVIKGKISRDWYIGLTGNAAKQGGKRLEKLQARGKKAIAAAGSVHGDAAVLLDICEKNPHIATMKAGWPPTSSDLSQAQLDGVAVNSTGQVTKLVLSDWQLTALPRTMAQLKALTELYVNYNKLPSTEVDFIIESFPQLTKLGLSGLGLTAMSGCVALTYIDLDGNKQLTAAGLEPFCASSPPKLRTLYLRSCDLDDSIGELQALTLLNLQFNSLSDAEKARVRAALPNCKRLRLNDENFASASMAGHSF
eukprot:g2333.t1